MANKKIDNPESEAEDVNDLPFPRRRDRLESMASAAAPAPAPSPATAPAAPEHKPSPMSLKVWLLTCGRRKDQTAGFRWWAEKGKLGPRTAPEWELNWQEFMSRPV